MMTAAEGFETLLKAMTDKDVKNVLDDFVTMQEDSVETLKKYL